MSVKIGMKKDITLVNLRIFVVLEKGVDWCLDETQKPIYDYSMIVQEFDDVIITE